MILFIKILMAMASLFSQLTTADELDTLNHPTVDMIQPHVSSLPDYDLTLVPND